MRRVRWAEQAWKPRTPAPIKLANTGSGSTAREQPTASAHLAHGPGVEAVVDEVLQVLAHADLAHQLVLVTVHACGVDAWAGGWVGVRTARTRVRWTERPPYQSTTCPATSPKQPAHRFGARRRPAPGHPGVSPVSWPTWEKVYCRPSASWKASTLPSRNCTLASTTSLVRRRIWGGGEGGQVRELVGRRGCAESRPRACREAACMPGRLQPSELRTCNGGKSQHDAVLWIRQPRAHLAAQVERVSKPRLLALLGGQRLDGLQVEVVVKMQV